MENYQTKFDIMLKRIPDTMYIFEVTKLCGHCDFGIVYKNASLMDFHKSMSSCFGTTIINNMFFMNPETKVRYEIPKSDFFTVRDLITKFQNDSELKKSIKPLYDLPANIVYKIYYDDGHAHDHANGCA